VLTLKEVYGSIAFYLANRAIVDQYLAEEKRIFEALRQQAREADPASYEEKLSFTQLAKVGGS